MFEKMIELIEAHATYGPAMKDAAAAGARIILDYHTHGPGTGYCVSIAKKKGLPMLGQPQPLQELVHIRGVGQEPNQCQPLMSALGQELVAHYQLKQTPLIYLNKKPFAGDGA